MTSIANRLAQLLAAIAVAVLMPSAISGLQAAEPLVYRRVFVPADALDSQIRGLLPLKRDEFERRLALIQQQTNSQAAQAVVRVEQAVFRARLNGNQLEGDATFAVVATAADAALLALQPCSFTIESAAWNAGDSRTAIFGMDHSGRLLCLVDHSGDLALKWRQAATAGVSSQWTFDFQFPPAPRRRLEIGAAANVELTIDSGLILASEPSSEEPDRRNWIIELTGRSSARLDVHSDRPKETPAPRIVVQDSTTYNVLPAAVDFEATLNLNILGQPVREFSLSSTQSVKVLGIQVDGQNAGFQVATNRAGGPERYLVEFPSPLPESNHVITISGTAARPAKGLWILPRLMLDGSLVQEGTAQIVAPGWMRLRPRPISGCIQTEATGAASGRNADRYDFQLFSPTAAIGIAPNRTLPPLVEDSGTQINVEASQVTGVFIAELTSATSDRFAVEAQISRQWIIDAVETQPSEMLADRSLTSGKGGFHELHLQLARPISNTRPLRVTIRAHYRRPANNEVLDASFFQLARVSEAHGGRQLVSVQVHDPSAQLILLGNQHSLQISPEQLAPDELSLFEAQPGPLTLKGGAALANLRAKLVPATPQYHADVLIRADVNRNNVAQSASIRCQPEASAVASVLVGLTPPPAGEVTWRLAGETLRDLPAVLESRPAANATNEHFFRVLLPRPQTSPFELIGEWNASSLSGSELALAVLPEATRQQGLLEVHSPSNRVSIRVSDLQPLPFAPVGSSQERDNSQESTLRGRYRYEFGRRGKVVVQFAAAESESLSPWIETLRLRSHFSADGRGEHEAQLVVHGGGESYIPLRLASDAIQCRLVKEDETEEPLERAGGEYGLRVPLNTTQERSAVRIRYASAATVMGTWPFATLTAPVPQPNVIVLAQTWEVLMPPQFSAMRLGNDKQHESPAPMRMPTTTVTSILGSFQSLARSLAGLSLLEKIADRGPLKTSTEAGFVGWNVVLLELQPGSEASLSIYHANTIAGWFWCLALVGVTLVGWLRRWTKWLPAAIAFVATIAMAVDPPWAWLAQGLTTGLVAGGICLLFWKQHASQRLWLPRFRRATPLLTPSPASSAAILLAIGLASVAAAPPAEPGDASQRRPKIVFPIDANQQPSGDYVYLDEQLYEWLHQTAERGPTGLPAWLLESAHYELPDAPKIRGEQAAVDELRTVFDFYTFHEAMVVYLPMHRDQVLLLEGRARLDGQPATLTWRADGGELSLAVPDAGRHRLELALGATARPMDDGVHVDLSVPSAAHSTITLPPGAELAGPIAVASLEAPRRVLHLSSKPELHIFWPAASLATAGAALLEAEQSSLWRVRSGSVVLESQFRLKPNGAPVREIVVEFDPRLRVLPAQGTSSIGRMRIETGSPNLLKIELPEPIATETTLRLAWLWPDASGFGQLELPTIRLRVNRLLRNWSAIALEAGIALDPPPAQTGIPTAAEFTSAFGETESGRIAAAWDASLNPMSLIATTPVVSQPLSEESIDWSISSASAAVTCTAQLTDVPRSRFEHRFLIDPKLHVEHVTLTQRGKSAAIRWEQQPDGTLLLTLLEPPQSEQTLTVQAELPLQPHSNAFPIPRVLLQDVKRRNTRLRINRQANAQLTLEMSEGWKPSDEPIGKHQPEKGRLVASLRGDAATASLPRVSIAANQPQIRGQMLIRVEQADGDWSAEIDLDLQIAGGVADELRLSVPAEWASRMEIDPTMEQVLEGTSGAARRRLLVRPGVAASGEWKVRLRGPLQSGLDGLRAPDIAVEGNPEIRRFVLLDRGPGGGQFDWDTTGLVAMDDSSRESLPPAWRDLSGTLFQVVASRFEATAHAKPGSENLAQIHLADLQAVLHGGRRLAVTAQVSVLPTATSDVEFSLPAGYRLLQTLVDGIAVPHSPRGLRSWKITSPSDVLPYRLTIVYDTFLPAGSRDELALRLTAPQWMAATVQKTLWSIESADAEWRLDSQATTTAGTKLLTSDRAETELIRLQSLAKTIEDIAAAQGGNIPPSVLAETFARWERLFLAAYQRLQQAAPQSTDKEWTEHARVCLDTVTKVRQRLQQAGIVRDGLATKVAQTQLDANSDPAAHFLLSADQQDLEIVVRHDSADALSSRLIGVIILAILTVALAVAPNISASRSWLSAHAHFLLGTSGFACWLLAPQGWLGLLLLVSAVGLSLRSPWPRGQVERGSTFLRNPVAQ